MCNVLMFPGQGAQFPGMGKVLYSSNNVAKSFFDKANDILKNDFLEVCFNGPDEKLTNTIYCQPALFVHSIAAIYANKPDDEIIKPDNYFLGLSLGELTALCVSGVFDFETGVKIVAERGKLMQMSAEKTSGAMASLIGGSIDDVRELCEKSDVEISNINCPGQIVISGETKKIEHALEFAKKMNFKRAIRLNVSGAYHSKLMSYASEMFAKFLENITFNNVDRKVLTNVTGNFIEMNPDKIKNTLVKQIVSTVQFQKCVETCIDNGANMFSEYGAGKVLCGLVKRIKSDLQFENFD